MSCCLSITLSKSKMLSACMRQVVRRYHNCTGKRKYLSDMFYSPAKSKHKEEYSCKSHRLLLANDIIYPCHSGAYYLLPFGQRVLEKLTRVIDDELQAIGGQKISMPTLAPSKLWRKTERWNTPELFKLKDRAETDYCLGPTHEELITDYVRQLHPLSYKRLPLMLYQITRKFRDEMAPKYGLLRGREFEMKDMYTFDATEENARVTYEIVCNAYDKIFKRLNLPFVKVAGATGNIGGKLSHEYHLPADIGQDQLLICEKCDFGLNKELVGAGDDEFGKHCHLKEINGIEVGHAFLLGTKYSEVLDACFVDKDGNTQVTKMGCFGLGVTRIIQASVEVLSVDDNIRWPEVIAPYHVCIIPQKEGYMADKFFSMANDLYDKLDSLPNLHDEILLDDRTQLTVGKRIKKANEMGLPYIVVVGRKALEEIPLFEVIETSEKRTFFASAEQVIEHMKNIQTV
ncbi:hypothetical protein CHS0354_036662 [Potamilus streckersoni]|uniref:Probable proline--tRNA ligase, mitochondrial n=1 Tax=Potamilus streckersoni TaxID=2493646 RepID=A0AAE0WC52_9BIVA|nr:hypothetical protein CHS0354_036662 [Potamilus streckersoni]